MDLNPTESLRRRNDLLEVKGILYDMTKAEVAAWVDALLHENGRLTELVEKYDSPEWAIPSTNKETDDVE